MLYSGGSRCDIDHNMKALPVCGQIRMSKDETNFVIDKFNHDCLFTNKEKVRQRTNERSN
jgi:hypothetical protein